MQKVNAQLSDASPLMSTSRQSARGGELAAHSSECPVSGLLLFPAGNFIMRQFFQPDAPHALRELIENTLARQSLLSGRRIEIDLPEEEIVLKGVVRSYYQKQLAQESVRLLDGSRRIRNELEVLSVR